MSDDEQGALFHVEAQPVRAPSRKESEKKARPVWSKYRTRTPVKCDDCMLLLAETRGRGPASQPARWRRKVGATDLLLCYGHAELRRTADGVA